MKKKATTKKSAPKKASKTATKKPAVKKAPAKKVAAKKTAPSGTKAPGKSSRRKDTPAVFKIKKSRNTPIVFSLDEVRQVLKEREKTGHSLEDNQESKAKAIDEKQKKVVAAEAETQEARSFSAASLADILGYNPNETESGGISDKQRAEEEAKLPKKFIKYYRALSELRDHMRDEVSEHTRDTLHRSSKDDSGDLSSYGQHQADAGTDAFDRDFALSLLSNEQDALYEVEEAIKRLFDGTYGICEQTGAAINKDRLMAVPFTRFSVEGQRQWERNKRKKVERGGVFADSGDDAPKIEESDD